MEPKLAQPEELYEYTVKKSQDLGLLDARYQPSKKAKRQQTVQLGLMKGLQMQSSEQLKQLALENKILEDAIKKLALKKRSALQRPAEHVRPPSSEKAAPSFPITGRPMPWEEKIQRDERSRVALPHAEQAAVRQDPQRDRRDRPGQPSHPHRPHRQSLPGRLGSAL
jgi:hypothetical protein